MNANADTQTLVKLHREYSFCLKGKVNEFLKGDKMPEGADWCPAEKSAYLEHMATHHHTQFANIMRLEENNF